MSEVTKPSMLLSLVTSLGLGGSSGAAISYYVQEAQGKAIERVETEHQKLESLIYSDLKGVYLELKEMNTRLSKIEGRLERQ